MKKLITIILALSMASASMFACAMTKIEKETAPNEEVTTAKPPIEEKEPISRENAVIVEKYEDFAAAELDSVVVVETYVQAKQSWWDGKGTFYTQNEDGAYFLYEMPCTEAEYKKLVPGTKIEVAGYKAEWAGEFEITEAEYKIIPAEPFIASALDVTELLGTDELVAHQNKFVTIKGMTVDTVEYKNGEPGDDVYVNLSKDGVVLSACIERYLTGPDTDVYKTAGELKVGDVVDLEGYLYWYEGANPHVTSIKVTTPAPEGAMLAKDVVAAEDGNETETPDVVDPAVNVKSEGTMTYAEYAAAELDAEVVVEGYIQAKQSWWDNKGTFYLQDGEGAYFLYEMPCTEEEYNALTIGTKIKATGYKAEWAGEVEIIEAQFEILADAQSYVATALDVTELLGTDELAAKQNMFVAFKDMTVEKVEYKNGEPGDDVYVTFTKGDVKLDACIEVYLTGPDTEVYKTADTLKVGDVVNVEGFLYWYEGVNPHVTSIVVTAPAGEDAPFAKDVAVTEASDVEAPVEVTANA